MLTGVLARPDSSSTNEQLLKLYWNRASVKRELRALRRERHELLDKLKEQEGAIVRAREQLDGLEKLLTNPLAAANAMVYFQLRHLWRIAAQRVEQFARELQAQREKRERAQLHEAALAKRRRRLDAINERLQSLFQKRRRLTEETTDLEQQLERMNPLMRMFRGPGSRRKLRGLKNGVHVLESRIEEFKELTEKIEGEPLPEPEGLSLESRRMINTAVIALAQHLVLHFSEHELASLAKTAMQRPVGDMKFGDRRDCDRMVERIREMIEELRKQKDLGEQVKRRADFLLATSLKYRNETDSVPMMESLETITPRISKDQGSLTRRASDAPLRINVLADDYWDIFNVLR
jgi:predicted  nucleic acid-binding Zn-ribbon protein